MTETLALTKGVTLRCIQSGRFRHGCLSLQFITPMEAHRAGKNALLPAVLLRGCRKNPDLRSITQRLDDLYGAAVGALVRRVGDWQTTGLCATFTEDRFAMDGDAILAPLVEFLGELLLDPATQGGIFRTDYVESERTNLLSTMAAQRNDKRAYAMEQLLRGMCRGDSFGLPRLGLPEAVEAITAQNLWDHYRRVLRAWPVEIFYVGSRPARDVAALLQPLARQLAAEARPLAPQTPFADLGSWEGTEEMDIAQGKLCLGFTTPIRVTDPRYPAMQAANLIFGGGMTSKLFSVIREKLSLCYAIGSGYYGAKGLVTVSAGIDFDKEPLVRREILSQLAACQRGEITQEELRCAKEALRTGLLSTPDSPGALENYYANAALSGHRLTVDSHLAAVEALTLEDVTRAAGTLRPHSGFFLKGVGA